MPAFHEPDEADVQTAIHYYAPHPGRSGPELNDLDLLLDMKQADSRRMPISNARGREDTFSIDRQGFEFIHLGDGKRFGSEMKAWDEMEVKQEYYPLVEEVYRKVTGAKKVIIFQHAIRAIEPEQRNRDVGTYLKEKLQPPSPRVHIDQSTNGAAQLMDLVLGEETARQEILQSERWAIMNVWKPLKTIYRRPLALSDSRTVPDSDLIEVPRDYGGKPGGNIVVKANSAHRWYYLHRQTPEEVVVFKIYDTGAEGVEATRVPHTSFEHPTENEGEVRESIETRAFLFW